MLRNSVLIIPSLNPDERLISYVEDFIIKWIYKNYTC